MAARIRHRQAPPVIRRTWPAGDHPVRWADRPLVAGQHRSIPRLITMHSQTQDLAPLPPHLLVVAVLAAGQIATFDTKGAMLGQVALGSDVSR